MLLPRVKAEILSIRVIPNVDQGLAKKFKLASSHRSIGLFTATSDDIGYTALDEATKYADVDVVYAKSFYAGANYSSGPLSGEFIGVIAGPTPEQVRSGLEAIQATVDSGAFFEALNEEESHLLFAHVVSRTGSYLSSVAGIAEGEALAYLIAPPLEAIYGLDAALKAADVEMCELFAPPSETNYGGGLLTGSQSACQAAADAFRDAITELANDPIRY
ncbi:ethanolamine utilization microcompartment protein EutL [Bacillus aerolatus]|uniref:Ethanolamine utilization microcompartment protein EutL n=1 Tax=Bacillus aerolatus TaxID=2653354 RepID=A0A6I1FFB3_9BACI|nr:ethanolamine utilization microcompartment protein EutL [Bacillus aerolatus]KAB7706656.1 ethanolamine utilization microcompartment protein EutL [Bacillus aerolatus]